LQLKKQRQQSSPFKEMDVVIRHHIRALQTKKTSAVEMLSIFGDFFRYVNTKDEILEVGALLLLPEVQCR